MKEFNAFRQYKKLYLKVWNRVYIYGFFYYLLNLITIISALAIAIIATVFIAGTVKYPNDMVNPYRSWFNNGTNYVISTTIINSVVALISGLLSFFLINKRFNDAKNRIQKINIEYTLYKGKEIYYSDVDKKTRDYILYKRVTNIVSYDRFSTDYLNELRVEYDTTKQG